MAEFKNEEERFEAYFKKISKCILDLTMAIVQAEADVTIVNMIDLLIKIEEIEDRNVRVKVLKEFKKGFVESKLKDVKEAKEFFKEEEEKSDGSEAN